MTWVYVPIGVLCILLTCWGVDRLIGLSSVSFPASVALLVMLFFGLILGQITLGDRRTKGIIQVIEIPVSLRATVKWNGAIGLWYVRLDLPFDTSMFSLCPLLVSPSFPPPLKGRDSGNHGTDLKLVTLPLSPPVSGVEVGKIIAVFRREISSQRCASADLSCSDWVWSDARNDCLLHPRSSNPP